VAEQLLYTSMLTIPKKPAGKNPYKNLVYCFSYKAVPKAIAYRGELWRFLLQDITQKPTVSDTSPAD